MWDIFKSKKRKQDELEKHDAEIIAKFQKAEIERIEQEKKAEEEKLAAEEEERKKIEPHVEVISIDFDEGDPRTGAFELDWNEPFVDWLRVAGYEGETNENIVDMWFSDLCKNVAIETWEQYDADPTNRKYIQSERISDGRKSVS